MLYLSSKVILAEGTDLYNAKEVVLREMIQLIFNSSCVTESITFY